MKVQVIKAAFTNLLFVIGIALLIFGATRTALTFTRILYFDEYPLPSYESSRCSVDFIAPLAVSPDGSRAEMSPEEIKQRKDECEKSMELQREQRQLEDIVTSVSLTISGILLVVFFRKYILK